MEQDYLKEQQRRLERLIAEGLESDEPTPFTKEDFAAIRERGMLRIKEKTVTPAGISQGQPPRWRRYDKPVKTG